MILSAHVYAQLFHLALATAGLALSALWVATI